MFGMEWNSPPPELDVEVLVALLGSEAQPGVERPHQLQHVPANIPLTLVIILPYFCHGLYYTWMNVDCAHNIYFHC